MKKIPTLFLRGPNKLVAPHLTPGCEWVHRGEGLVTILVEGLSCEIRDGKIYKRLKPGTDMDDAVFISTDPDLPADKLYFEAFADWKSRHSGYITPSNGIFSVIGEGIRGNPHDLKGKRLVKIAPVDGMLLVNTVSSGVLRRSIALSEEEFFEEIKETLRMSPSIEGLVFHFESPSMNPIKFAKIKRTDFGFPFPATTALVKTETTVQAAIAQLETEGGLIITDSTANKVITGFKGGK